MWRAVRSSSKPTMLPKSKSLTSTPELLANQSTSAVSGYKLQMFDDEFILAKYEFALALGVTNSIE